MDPRTGALFPTAADARAAGVEHPVELSGREEDIQHVAAAVADARRDTRRPVDDTHECPHNTCTRRVKPNLLACRDHWALVTPATQREVYAAYRVRRNDPGRHAAAISDAMDEMNE